MEAPGELGHRQIDRLLTGEQNPLTTEERKSRWRVGGGKVKGKRERKPWRKLKFCQRDVTVVCKMPKVGSYNRYVKRARRMEGGEGRKKKRRHNRRRPARPR